MGQTVSGASLVVASLKTEEKFQKSLFWDRLIVMSGLVQ